MWIFTISVSELQGVDAKLRTFAGNSQGDDYSARRFQESGQFPESNIDRLALFPVFYACRRRMPEAARPFLLIHSRSFFLGQFLL
ncbi:MAG: hypothetical protein CME32_03410 [Gimesia sp.]|nr:hypothetical protein [Gimesia sp.]